MEYSSSLGCRVLREDICILDSNVYRLYPGLGLTSQLRVFLIAWTAEKYKSRYQGEIINERCFYQLSFYLAWTCRNFLD